MKFLSLLFLCFFLSGPLFAQKASFEEGVRKFDLELYEQAVKDFERCYHAGNKSADLLSYLGRASFLTGSFESATHWLGMLIKNHPDDLQPEYILYYVQSLNQTNRLNEAGFWLIKFKEKLQTYRTTYYDHYLLHDELLEAQNMKKLNSGKAEYAPVIRGEQFIYVSNGKGKKRRWRKRKPKQGPFVDVFQIALNAKHDHAYLLSPVFTTKFNDGPVTFYDQGNRAILTMNDPEQRKASKHQKDQYLAKKINVLKLYESTYDTASKMWTNLQPLPVNQEGSSSAHATVSPSGSKLVFASDRKGGEGKSDLYLSIRTASGWSKPSNLKAGINTEDREVFPFFINDSTLLFSSDRPSGFGGLDFYLAFANENSFEKIIHLNDPLNSSLDDFGFYYHKEDSSSFFSSSRKGGKGLDDIYKLVYHRPDSILLNGLLFNDENGDPVQSSNLYFLSDLDDSIQVESDSNGRFKVYLKNHETYRVLFQHLNFVTYFSKIDASDYIRGRTFFVDLTAKKSIITGVVRSEKNAYPLQGVKVALMDKEGKNELTAKLTDKKGMFSFSVEPNVKYKVKVFLKGYMSNAKIISTIGDYMAENQHLLNFMMKPLKVGNTIRFDGIRFTSDSQEVIQTGLAQVDELIAILHENPSLKVEIGVHSDSRGDQFENLRETYAQARNLVKLLINKGGIDVSRISAKGYGESKLINGCGDDSYCSESEHQVNRRVELKILDY